MSIVKALLDKMGGSIEVESQLGEGSTFTFRLPFKVDENAIETKKEEQSSGEQKLEGKQILLVEDNEINMEIAEFYLKELGIVLIRHGMARKRLTSLKSQHRELMI